MSILHVDSIVKSYGNSPVLNDVFISCSKGEIVGLLGRNGCGKSTLLKIIFGSIKPENKFVKVGNKIIHGVSDGYKHIQYLPQDRFLPNKLKVKTIVNIFCDKSSGRVIEEHPYINPLLSKKCRELSIGERRFFEVALMIFSYTDFILLDEPFKGLSPLYMDEIKRLIKKQSDKKGFIITDHNYRYVMEISSRVVLLQDGSIKKIGDINDLQIWGYMNR